jgi:ribosomal protein S18 acetylase RimI-like enzyme
MFVTTTMLERLERAAWRDLYEHAPASLRAELGLSTHSIGSSLVLCATGLDHPFFNRAIGLGVAEPATHAQVRRVLHAYRSRGIERFFVHVTREASARDLRHWAGDEGLEAYPRAWLKLVRGAADPAPAPCAHPIARATALHAEAIGHIFTVGFGVPEAAGPLIATVLRLPGWHTLVAQDGGQVVAMGALYTEGELAYLAFAATLPSHRGRGIHAAMLAQGLRLARDRGCRAFVTETGEAVAGDPQHSEHNLTRAGFRVVAVRDNFAPPTVRARADAA